MNRALIAPMMPHNAPPRVSMAFQVLTHLSEGEEFAQGVPMIQEVGGVPQSPPEPFKRTEEETVCYRAALSCLVRYFTGELSYGDVEPNSTDKFIMSLDQITEGHFLETLSGQLVEAMGKIDEKRDELEEKRRVEHQERRRLKKKSTSHEDD